MEDRFRNWDRLSLRVAPGWYRDILKENPSRIGSDAKAQANDYTEPGQDQSVQPPLPSRRLIAASRRTPRSVPLARHPP